MNVTLLDRRSAFACAASTAVLALALVGTSAPAQRADQPRSQAGDQWQFAVYYSVPSTVPNRVWVVTSVTPTGIAGTENGEPLMLTPELIVLESPRDKSSNPKSQKQRSAEKQVAVTAGHDAGLLGEEWDEASMGMRNGLFSRACMHEVNRV